MRPFRDRCERRNCAEVLDAVASRRCFRSRTMRAGIQPILLHALYASATGSWCRQILKAYRRSTAQGRGRSGRIARTRGGTMAVHNTARTELVLIRSHDTGLRRRKSGVSERNQRMNDPHAGCVRCPSSEQTATFEALVERVAESIQMLPFAMHRRVCRRPPWRTGRGAQSIHESDGADRRAKRSFRGAAKLDVVTRDGAALASLSRRLFDVASFQGAIRRRDRPLSGLRAANERNAWRVDRCLIAFGPVLGPLDDLLIVAEGSHLPSFTINSGAHADRARRRRVACISRYGRRMPATRVGRSAISTIGMAGGTSCGGGVGTGVHEIFVLPGIAEGARSTSTRVVGAGWDAASEKKPILLLLRRAAAPRHGITS